MHILGNYSGYYYPISSNYFWNNRQAGQVVTPSQVDYPDSAYYLGPPIWKPEDAVKRPINFWARPPTAADVQSGAKPRVPSEYYASAGTMRLYDNTNFGGTVSSVTSSVYTLRGNSLQDKTSSIIISGGRWYAFEHHDFMGAKYGPFTDTGNVKGRYNYSGNFKNDVISSIYKVHDDATFNSGVSAITKKIKSSVESHKKVFTAEATKFVRDGLYRLNKYADASFCQTGGKEWNAACPPKVLKQWAQRNWSGVGDYMDGAVNNKYEFKVVVANALIPEGEPGGGKVGGGGYVITPADVAQNTKLPKAADWQAWNPPGMDYKKYATYGIIGAVGLILLIATVVIIVKVRGRGGGDEEVIIIEEE